MNISNLELEHNQLLCRIAHFRDYTKTFSNDGVVHKKEMSRNWNNWVLKLSCIQNKKMRDSKEYKKKKNDELISGPVM